MADRDKPAAARSDTAASGTPNVDTSHPELEAALEQGYLGQKVDPRPNEDYSLEGGAPTVTHADMAADQAQVIADQRTADQAAAKK